MKQTLHQDKRGVAHVALIAVVLVVAAAIGFAAYRVMNEDKDKDNNANQTSNQKKTEVPCQSNDEDLCKFVRNFGKVKSYRMTSTSTTEGQTATGDIKVQLPDRMHLSTKSGGQTFEVVTIGNDVYTKSGNTWWKQAPGADDEDPTDNYDFRLDNPTTEELGRYKKIGKEACGNLTCFKYQYTESGSPAQFYLFDDKDYLLRKVTGEGLEISFSYENVSVDTPSPVKELGPNQYIVPGQSEPMTMPNM